MSNNCGIDFNNENAVRTVLMYHYDDKQFLHTYTRVGYPGVGDILSFDGVSYVIIAVECLEYRCKVKVREVMV